MNELGIKEILAKENQQHKLYQLTMTDGIIDEICIQTDSFTLPKQPTVEQFTEVKQNVLDLFYRLLNFKSLLHPPSKSLQTPYAGTIKRKIAVQLKEKKQAQAPTSLDRELQVDHTISFHLSDPLFEEMWVEVVGEVDFDRPHTFQSELNQKAATLFPLNLQRFIERLKNNDNDFWGHLLLLAQRLTSNCLYPYKVSEKDILRDEIADTSCRTIKKKFDEGAYQMGTIPQFKAWVRKCCSYAMLNEFRKAKLKKTEVENLETVLPPDFQMYEEQEPPDRNVFDWDTKMLQFDFSLLDEVYGLEEFRLFVVSVLLEKQTDNPLYPELMKHVVQNKDIQLNILIDRYKANGRGLTYDELIDKYYDGHLMTPNERNKTSANLRKQVERMLKQLQDRINKLYNGYEKMRLRNK